MNRWLRSLCIVASIAAAPLIARAQERASPETDPAGEAPRTAPVETPVVEAAVVLPPPPPPPQATVSAIAASPPVESLPLSDGPRDRVVGLGTAIGGGVAVGGVYAPGSSGSIGYVGPAIELPSFEGLFFIDDHVSIDVSIPLLNTVIVGVLPSGFFAWATNVGLDFSIGDSWVRFIVGPELGFAVVSYSGYTRGQINLGALVGVELLSRGRGFGFRIMTRPQVQFSLPTDGGVFGVGGNALLELGFIGYLGT